MRRKLTGSASTIGMRACRAYEIPMSPMSWKSGSQLTSVSSVVPRIASAIARTLAAMLPCRIMASFGAPVEPEVAWRWASDSGVARGASSKTGSPRRASGVVTRTGSDGARTPASSGW